MKRTILFYQKLLLIGLLAAAMFGCKSTAAENAVAPAPAGSGGNAPNATASAAPNPTVAANANQKPADNSPKRIVFNKGANWGAANVSLAPGASLRFVVGAKSGQLMDVESSSKEVSINLLKGKAETTEDFGYLNAELKANGDFVFEVRNSTKKEIRTSVKVTIEDGQKNEIDESDATVSEDEDVLPPPNRKN